MSLMTTASGASLWRGYEYYTEKRVKSFQKISENEYECEIKGSSDEPYRVKIDTLHLRKSKCNCPHADGRRGVCKHMVALYFTVFPDEAKQYIKEVEEYEREEEQREQERYEEIVKYVNSMTKEELKNFVINTLLEDRRW